MRCPSLVLGALVTVACGFGAAAQQGEPRSRGTLPANGRRFYTDAVMQTVRQNLERYDWARKQRDTIVAEAERWLSYDDERLRTLVCPPEQPRAIRVHPQAAPVNGDALRRLGLYKWEISFDKPWTVTNPVDGKTYPSNDYAAFLASERQDRSLLTGEYPDDGWGCEVEGFEGKFWFVGYYAHWSQVRLLLPAVEHLSQAYLLTGDRRFAHACSVLLWQLAEYYPGYAYEKQSQTGLEKNPNYLGRLLYHTWESFYTAQTIPPAWDAVRETLSDDNALQRMTGLPADELQQRIEERLLATMARDIMDGSGRIQGNFGMHQVALLRIARVLSGRDVSPTPADMLDWVLYNDAPQRYTELGLMDAIRNLLYRDGVPLENPSYNAHWNSAIAEMIAELPTDTGKQILAMERVKALFHWPLELAIFGKFTPAHGDGGHLFHSLLGWNASTMEPPFRFYGDPIFAKALSQQGGRPSQDLFQPFLEEALSEAVNEAEEPLATDSSILHATGVGNLQTGGPDGRTALAMIWGYGWGHRHRDFLHIDLYSMLTPERGGYALCPDLGYPDTASQFDPRRFGWLSHTAVHNTVMIDGTNQLASRGGLMMRGRLWTYDPGRHVQVLDASAENAYPEKAKLYRRSMMLVDVDEHRAYAVDLFRVRGGSQHDWLLHGTAAAFDSDLPLGEVRTEGTLAGPDVPYGHFYDDPKLAGKPAGSVSYAGYRGSAFQWLFNVREAQPDSWTRARWTRGATLQTHFPGTGEAVFVCDGRPQQRKPYPDTLTFLVRRRRGDTELESTFVAVHEPYWDTPFIRSIRTLPAPESESGLPVAIEIEHARGRDVVLHRIGPSAPLRLEDGTVLDAAAAVVRYDGADGAGPRLLYLLDGEARLPGQQPVRATAARATVAAVDLDQRQVTLDAPSLQGRPAGGLAMVSAPGHAEAVPVAGILSPTQFSTGRDDLAAATVAVRSVEGRKVTFSPGESPYILPGLHAVNERGEAVGRVTAYSGLHGQPGWVDLERADLTLERFPDVDKDGRRIVRFAVVGPGDTITAHASWRADGP